MSGHDLQRLFLSRSAYGCHWDLCVVMQESAVTWQMAELYNYLDFFYSHQETIWIRWAFTKTFLKKFPLLINLIWVGPVGLCKHKTHYVYFFFFFFSDFVVLSYVTFRVNSWFQQDIVLYGISYLIQVFLLTTQLWKVLKFKTDKSILNISVN